MWLGVKLFWSHTLQTLVMTVGLAAALSCAVLLLPSYVSFADAVSLAGAAGKLNVVTTKFDWNDRYNLWSGLFGGMLLALGEPGRGLAFTSGRCSVARETSPPLALPVLSARSSEPLAPKLNQLLTDQLTQL